MAYIIKDSQGNPHKVNDKDAMASDLLGVVKDVDLKKRVLHMVGTDESRDRDGDEVSMKGWQLENYLKNPVFLWAHDYRSVPIGAATKLLKRRDPTRMEFFIRFPQEGMYPFADMILNLYQDKIINASSVGFIPQEWEEIQPKDGEGPNTRRGRKFTKQELLELSGCAVPSNPNALQNFLKGANFSDKLLEDLTNYLEAGKGTPPAPAAKDAILLQFCEACSGLVIEEETAVQIQVPEQIGKTPVGDEGNNPPIPDVLQGEDITWMTLEEVMKPFPNEHACRLNDPAKYTRFARKNCEQKSDDKCIDVIYGVKEGKAEIQALRYPKSVWAPAAAKSHCSGREGLFEAASGGEEAASPCKELEEYERLVAELTEENKDLREQIVVMTGAESFEKIGAVLNSRNKRALKEAKVLIQKVLDAAGEVEPGQGDQASIGDTNDHHDDQGDDLYGEILNGIGSSEGSRKQVGQAALKTSAVELLRVVKALDAVLTQMNKK